ncbi:hypothetical protein I4F81_002249 [Pyropia yezoensis]|uniref:Uncharacterized protein n=1 Tax=Pyropia yezoensis TaxID=2788 RepID=A0ACC3BPI5_PYRYE|nr:hypothetical protein I4F81_002249 [Neopyropia yezoensis]
MAASTAGVAAEPSAAERATDGAVGGVTCADGGAAAPSADAKAVGVGAAANPLGSDGSDGSDSGRGPFRLTRNTARVALDADADADAGDGADSSCGGSPPRPAADRDASGGRPAGDGAAPARHPSRVRGLFRRRSAPAPAAAAPPAAAGDAGGDDAGAAVPFFSAPGGSPPADGASAGGPADGARPPPRPAGGAGVSAPDLGHLSLATAAAAAADGGGGPSSAGTPSPVTPGERPPPPQPGGGVARAVLGRLGGGGWARPVAAAAALAGGGLPADAVAPAATEGATTTPSAGGGAVVGTTATAALLPSRSPPTVATDIGATAPASADEADAVDAVGATTTPAAAVGGVARLVFGRLGGAVGGDSGGRAEAAASLASDLVEAAAAASAAAAAAATADEEEGATPLALAVANGHPDTVRVLVAWGATPGSRWRKGTAAALARRRRDGGMMVALLAGREPSSARADGLGRADEATDGPAGCDGGAGGGADKDSPARQLRAAYRGFLTDPDSLTLAAVEAELLSPGRVRCFASLLAAHAILALAADAGVVATTRPNATVAATDAYGGAVGIPDAAGAAQRDGWFAHVYHEPFDALAPDEVALGVGLVRDAACRGLLERHHVAVLYSAYRIAASVRAAVGDLYARLDASTAAADEAVAALAGDLTALRAALRARDRRALAAGVAKVGLCLLPFVGGAVAAGVEVALTASPVWEGVGAAATAFLVNHGELGAAAEVLGALSAVGGGGWACPTRSAAAAAAAVVAAAAAAAWQGRGRWVTQPPPPRRWRNGGARGPSWRWSWRTWRRRSRRCAPRSTQTTAGGRAGQTAGRPPTRAWRVPAGSWATRRPRATRSGGVRCRRARPAPAPARAPVGPPPPLPPPRASASHLRRPPPPTWRRR